MCVCVYLCLCTISLTRNFKYMNQLCEICACVCFFVCECLRV